MHLSHRRGLPISCMPYTVIRCPGLYYYKSSHCHCSSDKNRQKQLGFTSKGNILWVLYWRMSCFLYWRVRSVGFYIKRLNVKPVKTSNANFNSILKRLLERALAESVVHSVRCCPHTPGSYRGLQPMDGGVAHATMPLPFTHNGYGRCRGLGEKPAFGPSSQGTPGTSCGHRES